jgi:hypothetical protein
VEQLSPASKTAGINAGQSLPLPGTEAYEALPQFPKRSPLPFRRTIRRRELRQMVPLAETTIYEMECRLGLGRSGSVDRGAQASPPRRHLEAGCPPTKNPPCPGGLE